MITVPINPSSSVLSSSGAFPVFNSLDTALPPKISPAPVVSIGFTSGHFAYAAPFWFARYAPFGPIVIIARRIPNSSRSFFAASFSSVIPQRNSTSSSLIFTTSACASPHKICSFAASVVSQSGSLKFGSNVMNFPCRIFHTFFRRRAHRIIREA